LGTSTAVPVDFRLVAATNRNLKDLIARGEFRDDLYYRLQVFTIILPPLRDRKSDIPALVATFLLRHGAAGAHVEPDAIDAMLHHDWPGNVRELENCVQRAVILAGKQGVIRSEHLGLSPLTDAFAAMMPPAVATPAASDVGAVVEAAPPSDNYDEAKRSVIESFQRRFVERALARSAGNISRAAQECGLTRAAFKRIMRALGTSRDDFVDTDDGDD
ncbi:MAG: sigma 54-interacting transcriptional regulator, partial [Planctomycetota bacterium]